MPELTVDFELVGGGPKDGLRGLVSRKRPQPLMKFELVTQHCKYFHVYQLDDSASSKLKYRYIYKGLVQR